MQLHSMRHCCPGVLVALLLWPLPGWAGAGDPISATVAAPATPPSAVAIAQYRRQLEEYTTAHRKYEGEANAYWGLIADKRRIRNAKRHNNKEILIEDYVLTQPPV
jgi:hypothetical protein